jgi:ATP-dependent helicase HrpB
MLPIHEALPRLKAALTKHNAAVLVAPPGAGKTTVVPLALLDEAWARGGKLIVLEPRRLAARAAAARMARTLGEEVGETVGLRVRLETRISARTRVEVVTEGVFTRMILEDPALDRVAAVLFDEFHERSLDADLGLAFARDSQSLLRPDLRLLVMSATLDGGGVSRLLDDAPVIESRGKVFEVATRYLGRAPGVAIEDQVAAAIGRALGSETGGVLVFLPGQGEILRVARRLADNLADPTLDIVPLYGALDVADQDRAITPPAPGRRKVVLASAVAESSLTIEGVQVVIDCGLARVPRYDAGAGLTRLVTVRVSRASADQRRGRAGRTAPGVCYRLWDEEETRALPAFARPEILETDLTRLALDLARWGARSLDDLAFLDRPPAAALAQARTLLKTLGALDENGFLTGHGEGMSSLSLPPRLAHMILRAADAGQAARAAAIAALITERGLGGRGADLGARLDAFAVDRSSRALAAGVLAARWAREAGRQRKGAPLDDGVLVALAYPERIAKARGGAGEFQLASGRGVFLDPAEPLARETWLAVAELGGGAARDRILLAARLSPAGLRHAFAAAMTRERHLAPGPGGGLRVTEILWLGRLVVEERPISHPDPRLIEAALFEEVRRRGLGALAWGETSRALRARLAFLHAQDPAWPSLSDQSLVEQAKDWLAPILAGQTSLAAIDDKALEGALRALIPWDLQRRLDAQAPARWTAPTGSTFAIDYTAPGGPRVDVRVQELFGLTIHPAIGAGVDLTLALLSPAGRPIQLTRDLPGFWKGSWSDVRRAMRGRYPKHPWPADPATAAAIRRIKPRA